MAILAAAMHKSRRWYVRDILDNLDYYAEALHKALINGTFVTRYTPKTICDGLNKKPREILIPHFFPDQCAHHAIIQVLKPQIKKSAYIYSCANIEGRGTDYGSIATKKLLYKTKAKYAGKMDIRQFYPSIKNHLLKDFIKTKIKDKKALELIFRVIDSNVGLPIGNYTSPWFAEWFLQRLDHYIKEKLHIKMLVRYADDIVIGGTNKRKIQAAVRKIIIFAKDVLGLEIKHNYQVFPIKSSDNSRYKNRKIDFLGKCFATDYITIRKIRALSIMCQSRFIFKKQMKNQPIEFHTCAGFISRIAVFKTTDSLHMRIKYLHSIVIKNLKEIIRQHSKIKKQGLHI